MDELLLRLPEIAKLKAAHRHAKTRREADRSKAVVLRQGLESGGGRGALVTR